MCDVRNRGQLWLRGHCYGLLCRFVYCFCERDHPEASFCAFMSTDDVSSSVFNNAAKFVECDFAASVAESDNGY